MCRGNNYPNSVNEEECCFYVCLWKIWSQRNVVVHDSSFSFEVDIVEWASGFISDFHNVCVARDRLPAFVINRNPIWIPHDLNIYKINCDAAINVASCLVGFGNIIRNSEGPVMASSSQNIIASFSPQVAEAEAIHQGLLLAIDAGLFPCLMESNAEVVVGWINSVIPLCSDIGVVIMDIQNLLKLDLCISINFVPRKTNIIAHVLAKNGLSTLQC
ncbi:hypothetical protein Ddye_015427 [Dipteronia dyeriana]|uniref:RNase H type-1 domain-containing protein n=1 Tax=Dipteronia dyeriana TaxID=168575 RepID=A0AAD9U5I9_9ROSI|nr:hypothetical protein Ddye_015427 [Dipteronia dyeriana]